MFIFDFNIKNISSKGAPIHWNLVR